MTNVTILEPEQVDVKRITVKFVGGTRPSETLTIRPGNTAGDVLGQLGLDQNFTISPDGANMTFNRDEPIFGAVRDGDLLYVTSVVDAGASHVMV